jgi:hypothetical protein
MTDMAIASKIATGLVALPHLLLVLKNGDLPRLNYIALLSICLFLIFSYSKMVEVCSGTEHSPQRAAAAALLPFVVTWAFSTSALLYTVNDRDLYAYLGTQASLLGTPLGQVRQYRLNDVIHRFRDLVTTRQEEQNVSVL